MALSTRVAKDLCNLGLGLVFLQAQNSLSVSGPQLMNQKTIHRSSATPRAIVKEQALNCRWQLCSDQSGAKIKFTTVGDKESPWGMEAATMDFL